MYADQRKHNNVNNTDNGVMIAGGGGGGLICVMMLFDFGEKSKINEGETKNTSCFEDERIPNDEEEMLVLISSSWRKS